MVLNARSAAPSLVQGFSDAAVSLLSVSGHDPGHGSPSSSIRFRELFRRGHYSIYNLWLVGRRKHAARLYVPDRRGKPRTQGRGSGNGEGTASKSPREESRRTQEARKVWWTKINKRLLGTRLEAKHDKWETAKAQGELCCDSCEVVFKYKYISSRISAVSLLSIRSRKAHHHLPNHVQSVA